MRTIEVQVGTPFVEIEKQVILATLESVNGNRTKAAKVLQLGVRTIQRKLKEYKVSSHVEGVVS